MMRLLLLLGLVGLAAAGKPFLQTPEFIMSMFDNHTKASISQLPANPVWTNIGPDRTSAAWAAQQNLLPFRTWVVDGGRVRGFLQDPTNLNRVFVLYGGGGVWRSDNFWASIVQGGLPGATQWRALTPRLPNNGGAIAFGPLPNVVYYAIGDAFGSLFPTSNPATSVSGVLVKSTDAGDTWGAPVIIDPLVSIIWDLDVIPGCAADGTQDTLIVSTDVGMYISRDGGRTFARTLPVNPNPPPNQPDQTINTWSVIRTSAGWMASAQLTVGGTTSVFRSADGITWNPTPVFTFPAGTVRVTLFQALKNDPTENVVYALAAQGRNWLDIFRSADGGLTFQALGVLTNTKTINTPATVAGNNLLGCIAQQADYNQALLIDPTDRNRNTFIMAGALGVIKTTDAGATVSLVGYWAPGAGGNDCPNTNDINYVHADGHAAIALVRPDGITIPRQAAPPARQPSTRVPRFMPKPLPYPPAANRSRVRVAQLGSEDATDVGAAQLGSEESASVGVAQLGGEDSDSTDASISKAVRNKRCKSKHGKHPCPSPSPAPSPPPCAVPPTFKAGPWDLLLGTDGGMFFSANTAAGGGGNVWDNGRLNIGTSTFLITHIQGTPLNRDMLMIGTQDNSVRLRVGQNTAWEQLTTGDGQGVAIPQAGPISDAQAMTFALNWGCPECWSGIPLAQLDTAQRTNNPSAIVPFNQPPPGTAPATDADEGLTVTFGLPPPAVDPTGLIWFTRTRVGLYCTRDAGRTYANVRPFPQNREEDEGDLEDVQSDQTVYSALLHNIAVAPGTAAGTMSVAVMSSRTTIVANTNFVEVSRSQASDCTSGATWSSSSPTTTIPNWADPRLFDGATTTSPQWGGPGGNTLVYVSSVALPSTDVATPRPRVAFAPVTEAGIGAFTACTGTGLPDTPVQRILVDGTTIYAATWVGVYRSTDACATFTKLGSERPDDLPNVQVRDLYLNKAAGLLSAGTFGRSAWQTAV